MTSVTTRTYAAVCRRSGGWWAISVPELRGVHSQARRLDQVPAMAREAIALMLDVEPSTITVEVKPQTPQPVTEAVKARRAAREVGRRAERATERAVEHLLSDGYTVRDAGKLLGVSPQRVSQIAATLARPARKSAGAKTSRATTSTRRKAAIKA